MKFYLSAALIALSTQAAGQEAKLEDFSSSTHSEFSLLVPGGAVQPPAGQPEAKQSFPGSEATAFVEETITLGQPRVSCGCVTPALTANRLAPGESAAVAPANGPIVQVLPTFNFNVRRVNTSTTAQLNVTNVTDEEYGAAPPFAASVWL